jgi:polar amino acid transport system substrate-binding protein
MKGTTRIREVLAPTGKLRASINIGNPVLARRDSPSNAPYGVSVDLALAVGGRMGVGVEFLVFDSARQSVDAVANGTADIGFFAIDPKRGESIAFTDAYLHIEGWYAVKQDSPVHTVKEVDRPGTRIAVGRDSAYDLFLSRELKHAEIVRAANPKAVTPLFVEQHLDLVAGIKQQLEMDMQRYPGLRLLPERFMLIRQAMGLGRSRGDEAHTYLSVFIEEIKANGVVEQSLIRHDIQGATVAPLNGNWP